MAKIFQAVILVAGKGTRLWPITVTKPKPFLKVGGKTILEHNLDQLTSLVKEVILVVGYKKEMIEDFVGSRYKNLKITYVWQKTPAGTGDAVLKTKNYLKDKFLVLNGDDIYFKEDIEKCLEKSPCILLKEIDDVSRFGLVLTEKDFVKKIIEKPGNVSKGLVNTGVYFLGKEILNKKIKKSKRGEYEITDYLRKIIEKEKLYFKKVKDWFPISYPWDLLSANEYLLNKMKRRIEGKIEKNCQLLGLVVIEKGTIIKSGAYIEGPVLIGENCQIGPNCYIRKFTSIGNNCRIGQAVEIKNSIIGQNTKIAHLSYIGDSIIGENCALGAGTISANVRLDSKTIKTKIKGKLIDTKRKKFGCVLGGNTKTGLNVSLMPGVLVGANCLIYPKAVIFKNVKGNTVFKGK